MSPPLLTTGQFPLELETQRLSQGCLCRKTVIRKDSSSLPGITIQPTSKRPHPADGCRRESSRGPQRLEVAFSPPSQTSFHSLPPQMCVIKHRPNPITGRGEAPTVLTGPSVQRPCEVCRHPSGMNPAQTVLQTARQHRARSHRRVQGKHSFGALFPSERLQQQRAANSSER